MNSRQKGARGERQWAKFLKEEMGVEARRGCQFSGSPDSPDVVSSDGIHWEVKRTQTISINQALSQAIKDANDKKLPAVAWKKNRQDWVIILRAKDWIRFKEKLAQLELKSG